MTKQRFLIAVRFDEDAVDGRHILQAIEQVSGVEIESMQAAVEPTKEQLAKLVITSAAGSGVVDDAAVDDPEGYDSGLTIGRLRGMADVLYSEIFRSRALSAAGNPQCTCPACTCGVSGQAPT